MKLRLNLSTVPPENKRPFLFGAAVAGCVGALTLLILSYTAYSSWVASRSLRADIARLQEELQVERQKQQDLRTYFKTPDAQQILDRSAFLNSLIDARSFPWTKIFMDLETTLPPGVRVVSISPKLVNGRAQVELEIGATTDESKIQFLQAMEKSTVFSGMVVKGENDSDRAGAADRIVMQLSVWYSTT